MATIELRLALKVCLQIPTVEEQSVSLCIPLVMPGEGNGAAFIGNTPLFNICSLTQLVADNCPN